MIESGEEKGRDLSALVVPRAGRLVATGDDREPYRVVGPDGQVAEPVSVFLRDLLASGRSAATLRSYAVDLLRWWRFLDAVDVEWDRASRVEARDFSCWIQLTVKHRLQTTRPQKARLSSRAAGSPNPVTGKPASGDGYAPSTVAHSETVLRRFYDFHRDGGTGPVLNPFPLDASRRRGRPHAHHNPMDEWRPERTGRYRPVVPKRIPRAIPDDWFNRLFAALGSDRDRALVAFWISTGARASELLRMRQCDFLPGEQLISVVRKGTRASQQLPASADAFVWHRLYQQELLRLGVPRGRRQPAWWTLRRPYQPLSYHGAHRMFERVNASLGADWTLHDLRHSAASRMARDGELSLTDVQWVLGHAHLTTTEIYLTPTRDEVIEGVLAHHARQSRVREAPPPQPAPGYDPQSLSVLFGRPS
ncbi:MAG: tyrosine-type recombinase/integrase [Streptosporangiaceae bacterium]